MVLIVFKHSYPVCNLLLTLLTLLSNVHYDIDLAHLDFTSFNEVIRGHFVLTVHNLQNITLALE